MTILARREDLSILRYRKSGRYHTDCLSGGVTSGFLSSNRLYGLPFLVFDPSRFDRIAITIITAGGTKARLGIYADNGLISPGKLVLDAGEVSTAAVATVEITIDVTLPRGLFWLASIYNGGPTIRAVLGAAIGHFFGYSSGLDTSVYAWVYRSYTYGTLPDPFGACTITAGNCPMVCLRMV